MGRGSNATAETNVLYGSGKRSSVAVQDGASGSTRLRVRMPGKAMAFLENLPDYADREIPRRAPAWKTHWCIDADTIGVYIDAESEIAVSQFKGVATLMLAEQDYEITEAVETF